MIQIDDKIISQDLFEVRFVCDYDACRGICCVEGDSGAPVDHTEVMTMRRLLPLVESLLSPEALEVIHDKGISYRDESGEEVTQLVHGRDCVFTTYDAKGRCLCAFEKIYREGKSTFPKPISCHLYPIRIHKYKYSTALNYDRWDICQSACSLGKKLNVPVFRALKEPLIRAFGADFFDQLEEAARLLEEELPHSNSIDHP
ncbi:MAG: DUF3109 family protein [Bacteroidales bacterium]|nr:DUF3109 family protein [Porphyromonas sp.]MDD6934264.1 DUF3109 family protein [Bacteroidales bacterium]MDY3101769.1 DUF3109 family protein [Porphyromonas sp.]